MLGRTSGLLAILVVVSLMLTHSLSGETLQKSLSGQTVKEQAQQSLRSQNAQLQPQNAQLQPQNAQLQPQNVQSQSQSTQPQQPKSAHPQTQRTQQGEIYRGQLRDRMTQEPISMATVILLSADSTVVSTTLSSDGGTFELSGAGAHWLQVNHLAYQTLRVSLDAPLPDVLYMDQATGELGEVVVKAERPLMKLVDGTTPSYDIDQLFAHSSVTTAYEMLGQLPGMSMQGDVPTLVGTNGYTLVFNGQPSNVPQDMLLERLKSIPREMVASVEISYTPIARYRAKGASINVVFKGQAAGSSLGGTSGQLFTEYSNKYYSNYAAGGSVNYSAPNGFSVTANYRASLGKIRSDLIYDIAPFGRYTKGLEIENSGYTNYNKHTLFAELGYKFGRHALSVDYYGSLTPPEGTNRYQVNQKEREPLESLNKGNDNTHHVAINYRLGGNLLAGLFYTHYRDHREVLYGMEQSPRSPYATSYTSDQLSQVWGGHIDNSHSWDGGWGLSYGSKVSYSKTINGQTYLWRNGREVPNDAVSGTSKELLADLYIGGKKQFKNGLSLGLTLIGDYANYIGADETFQIIPQASLSYARNPNHVLQVNIQSSKRDPSYWEREPFSRADDRYQLWEGNPQIRPYVTYSGQVNYIFKQRYVFFLSGYYQPLRFEQQMYLDPYRSRIVYKTWNWHYASNASIGAVVPLPQTKWWNARLTLNGQLNSVKLEIPYEPTYQCTKPMYYVALSNEFRLSQKHNITIGLDGSYLHGAIQGYYSLGDIYNIACRAKWTSQDKKWSLTLRGDDLLNAGVPRVRVNYGIHQVDFRPSRYNTRFSVHLSYTFGSFDKVQTKEPTQLSTDRFGI